MSESSGSDIFGYIAGASFLIALGGSLVESHLPNARMRLLEEVFKDTEAILHSLGRQWWNKAFYLTHTSPRNWNSVSALQVKSSELRVRTVCATTPWKEYTEFCSGLSRSIGTCLQQVKELRALVVSTTEAERRRLYNEQRGSGGSPTTAASGPTEVTGEISSDSSQGSSENGNITVSGASSEERHYPPKPVAPSPVTI
ncbi:hypothetical protein SERLADRAFT_383910 [Serpula lacrymans var. lacrymans S7.9]|uniref:Uncharacterized protein n=1 Tax=Serpula lacrymans var. lacrymans (strain S7.9) TaxID=578457 RepID=F8NN79_SERL9|nr:uncharacterized protein SERLADRAFT_383910 [Serpula lacrymans var. lacrymans S7.9]EGO28000.1 hypothetical protein SERLADRAFT_383910 [Serpula lacrymans var. lacrymans S7.9]